MTAAPTPSTHFPALITEHRLPPTLSYAPCPLLFMPRSYILAPAPGVNNSQLGTRNGG
jgi:hypothetical protein